MCKCVQVHRAKLVTGEEVVLKVQKPGVASVLKADLGFIYIASKVIELLQPELARTSFSAVSYYVWCSVVQTGATAMISVYWY
jgi:predicted unusual protein kinase regulating ubiquinone biosynthesis (AarF/ABC1/UbiB family)